VNPAFAVQQERRRRLVAEDFEKNPVLVLVQLEIENRRNWQKYME